MDIDGRLATADCGWRFGADSHIAYRISHDTYLLGNETARSKTRKPLSASYNYLR